MMLNSLQFDLNHLKKRLEFYQQLKTKAAPPATGADNSPPTKKKQTLKSPVEKWVEIYSVRIALLEKKIQKQSLASQTGAGNHAH